MNYDNIPATLGGLGLFILVMIIKDLIRDKISKPIERSKVDNLSEQTRLLGVINDSLAQNQKINKKQLKKIRRRLDTIHDDVITVKKQTTPMKEKQNE